MAIQDFFRLRNLLSDESDSNVLPSYSLFGSSDYDEGLARTPALDAFAESVMSPPERAKPSLKRMVGTGLLSALRGSSEPTSEKRGFWGSLANKPFTVDETTDILHAPFEQKLADWTTRTKALQQAANIESQIPARQALAASRMGNLDVSRNREQRLGREGEAKIDIARQKQSLSEWKAKNPDGKVIPLKGGNVIVVNPQTGEATDTGVPSGSLSDLERINLTGQQKMEQIGAQIQGRKELQSSGQEDALERIKTRGEEQRTTKQTIPGKASGSTSQKGEKELSPTQQRANIQNRANQLVVEVPEYSNYIKVDPNTKGILIEEPYDPNKHWSWQKKNKPSLEEYNDIYEYVYGTPRTKTQASPATTQQKKEAKPAAKATATPSDKVIVQDKSGKRYRLPASQLKDAIAQGYTQVK